jgi:hypothetical protein
METEVRRPAFALRKVLRMPVPLDSPEVLNREFLEIRARLLHIAASLDRIDRAEGAVAGDPRLELIRRSLAVLADDDTDRAEKIQLLFSRSYDSNWKSTLLGKQSKG